VVLVHGTGEPVRPKQFKRFANSFFGFDCLLALCLSLLCWMGLIRFGARAAETGVPSSVVFWQPEGGQVSKDPLRSVRVASGPEQAARVLGDGSSRYLRCWFCFETERDERFVLFRRFTVWTNDRFHCCLVLSNLVA